MGSTDYPAVSTEAPRGRAEPDVCRDLLQTSHPHPVGLPTPRLIRGFILRHAPRCPENAFFLDHVRTSFLLNLRRQLPRNVLDTSWPTPPPALREVCRPSLRTWGLSKHSGGAQLACGQRSSQEGSPREYNWS